MVKLAGRMRVVASSEPARSKHGTTKLEQRTISRTADPAFISRMIRTRAPRAIGSRGRRILHQRTIGPEKIEQAFFAHAARLARQRAGVDLENLRGSGAEIYRRDHAIARTAGMRRQWPVTARTNGHPSTHLIALAPAGATRPVLLTASDAGAHQIGTMPFLMAKWISSALLCSSSESII